MFNYTLSEKDIITFMSYYISSNRNNTNQGKKSLWIYSAFFVGLALINYALGNITGTIVIFSMAVFFVLYALFLRDYLMNRGISKIAVRDLKDMIGSNVQLEIKEDHLYCKDQAGEYKYLFSGFVLISELDSYYFIRLNNAQSVIIPKISVEMEQSFNAMISNHQLPYKLALDFKNVNV